MKKYLSTALLTRSVVLVLLISGGILNTTDISAQTAGTFHSPYTNIPAGSLVDVPTAIIRVTHHLEYLKVFMSQLNPTSQQYQALQESYTYFELIHTILTEANTIGSSVVAEAIVDALELMSTDAYGGVSIKKHPELRQSAITLLKA